MIIFRICAWCGKFLGFAFKKREKIGDRHITHTICKKCMKKIFEGIDKSK